MVRASNPDVSVMRRAAAAGGRAEEEAGTLGGQDAQDGVDDGGLADAGTAGDDQHLRRERQPDRGALALCERESGPLLDPGKRLVRVDLRPGERSPRDAAQPARDSVLGPVQAGEEDARRIADPIGDDAARGQLLVDRRPDEILGRFQKPHRQRQQLLCRQAAMPIVHGLGQRMADACTDPDHGRLVDAEPHRDGVGGLEADAADVAGQPIGILRHHLHRVGAVGLEDAHRARGPDPVAVQEHHDLAHRLLLGPGGGDPLRPHRADAVDLPQAFGARLDDVEHPLAECTDELLRIDRSDTPDHAGAEIPLDALGRGGRGGLQEPRPELRPVGAVVHPLAGCGESTPRRRPRRRDRGR